MSRIYIVGFMGVGKSTVGKKLASHLGYKFIDTDKQFEKKYKLGINDFFAKYGEELFRKLENEILQSTFQLNDCVISTGGGLPCYENAINEINENGISVFLEMNENAIFSRLINSKQKRPLVRKLSENELKEFIECRLAERNPIYKQAAIIIPALSADIEEIISKINVVKK